MAIRRFGNEKKAKSFAKAVNGELKDLREIPGAISKFKVTYTGKKNRKKNNYSADWSPEEDRDFGYSNEFWK